MRFARCTVKPSKPLSRSSLSVISAGIAATALVTYWTGSQCFGGHVATNVSRFPPFDLIREARARTDDAPVTTARSSPPSVRAPPARCGALADQRPIVVGGDGCGRETLIQSDSERCRARMPNSACPPTSGSRSSTTVRVPGSVVSAGAREAGARTDDPPFAPARSSPPSIATRRASLRAFADRRIVAGGEGGRVRTRSAHPVSLTGVRISTLIAMRPCAAAHRAGDSGGRVHRRACARPSQGKTVALPRTASAKFDSPDSISSSGKKVQS
jgi:hypothetical protein